MTNAGQSTRNTRQPAGAYLVPGVRTPFAKAGSVFAKAAALELSAPVARAMADKAQPDLLLW